MSIQKANFKIIGNGESAMSLISELLYNSFSVSVECTGEIYIIEGEREPPDDDPDDDIRAGHTLH
jgi:hypothetical protein